MTEQTKAQAAADRKNEDAARTAKTVADKYIPDPKAPKRKAPGKLKKLTPKALADDAAPAPKTEERKPAVRKVAKGSNMDKQLRELVTRIENLEKERKAIAADIKEVYDEAKSNGFDAKILRKLVILRRRDQAEVNEENALLQTYAAAVGMYLDMETDTDE